MNFNYLRMIWDVKIYLAKIKDGKGKDLKIVAKKNLLTTIRPKYHQLTVYRPGKNPGRGFNLNPNPADELEEIS